MKLVCLAIVMFAISGCSKTKCDCPPPADVNINYKWQISERSGGVSGTKMALTDDQKNSVLNLYTNQTYMVKNMVTNAEVTGTYKLSDFNSIYGNKPRVIFTPNLPMLSNEFHILVENPPGKFVFGDNLVDGYQTTFVLVP